MRWIFVASHLMAFVFLALVMVLVRVLGMPVYSLMADPAAVNNSSAAVGFLSNLGVVMLAGAAAIALFAAFVHSRQQTHRDVVGLFAALGVLTAVIMLDDLYMLHERIVPGRFGIGTDATAAIYAASVALIAWRWRAQLRRFGLPLAFSALFWLGLSLAMDFHLLAAPSVSLIYEDGAKFVGMVCWSAWIGYAAAQSFATLGKPEHHAGSTPKTAEPQASLV